MLAGAGSQHRAGPGINTIPAGLPSHTPRSALVLDTSGAKPQAKFRACLCRGDKVRTPSSMQGCYSFMRDHCLLCRKEVSPLLCFPIPGAAALCGLCVIPDWCPHVEAWGRVPL